MSNPVLIHLNRRFHVPIDSIRSVTQKKWGSVWVEFFDEKSKKNKIAIAKTSMSNILTILNNYNIMNRKPPILGIIEK